MMSRLLLFAVLIITAGCISSRPALESESEPCEVTEAVLAKVQYVTGADPCDASAITIKGASCERVGVAAERRWLDQHFPGYDIFHQALASTVVGSPCPATSYDIISFKLPSGERRGVTFDITEFYGK